MSYTDKGYDMAEIGVSGWRAATTPPDSDRIVQIAWDDWSYGPNSLGFHDGVNEIPDSGRRYWWSSPVGRGYSRLGAGAVSAWREIPLD